MEKKIVNRNILKSNNLRIKYGDSRTFQILQVNLTFENKVYTYEIDAKYLSTDVDSIHVKPSVENGVLKLSWTKRIEPFVRFVLCK